MLDVTDSTCHSKVLFTSKLLLLSGLCCFPPVVSVTSYLSQQETSHPSHHLHTFDQFMSKAGYACGREGSSLAARSVLAQEHWERLVLISPILRKWCGNPFSPLLLHCTRIPLCNMEGRMGIEPQEAEVCCAPSHSLSLRSRGGVSAMPKARECACLTKAFICDRAGADAFEDSPAVPPNDGGRGRT